MVTTESIKSAGLALVTTLMLLSVGIQFSPDDTHYCTNLELAKQCDRLSSTSKTCYPTADTRVGSKYCSDGWVPIVTTPEGQATMKCYGWLEEQTLPGGEIVGGVSNGIVDLSNAEIGGEDG